MKNAYMVVDLGDKTYFWCSTDTFEPMSGWETTIDLLKLMHDNKCISWLVWQDFMMCRCFCDGRGD
jgi:hypothetical protein